MFWLPVAKNSNPPNLRGAVGPLTKMYSLTFKTMFPIVSIIIDEYKC